jgi:cytidylate kinase
VTSTVICISHATGAGGVELGRAVAERLGLRLVDEEIVIRAAEKEGVTVVDLTDVERRKSLLGRILRDIARGEIAMHGAYGVYVDPSAEPLPDPKSLRALIRQSITETADDGDVVIVSHAASYALSDRDDVLRVFVTASPETRTRRLAAAEGLDEKQAKKAIETHDTNRADYLKRFYGVGSEHPTHYDLVVNTDRIPVERATDLVVNAASS